MKTSATRRLLNLALADNAHRSFNELLSFTQASPAYLVRVLNDLRKSGVLTTGSIGDVRYYWFPTDEDLLS